MTPSTRSPRLSRVRQISLAFRVMCRVLIVLTVLLLIALAVPMVTSYGRGSGGDLHYAGVRVLAVLTLIYWVVGLWMLERLFSVFASGRVFAPESGRWLTRFGFWVATVSLLPLGGRMALDWAAYGRLGAVGEGPFAPAVGALFVGLFLMMLGWVLEEASELQAEQDLTV